MKRALFVLALFALAGFGCNRTAEYHDRVTVEKQQKQYAAAQPVPVFDWSVERDTAIQLYKLRNQSLKTWSVWYSDMGTILGHCESVGYPLPYDVQLTNPMAPVKYSDGSTSSGAVVEQPEPNGLFSSKHTTATWIRALVKVKGKTVEVPLYIESKVHCYPYPVVVDYKANRVTAAEDAVPSAVLEKGKAK